MGALALALTLTPAAAAAQSGRVSLEGRGGIAMPRGDLRNGGAHSGFAAGLDLMHSLTPWLSAYVGVSRDEFDGGFSSSGGQLGAKLVPGVWGSTTPWLNAGMLGQKMTAGNAESDFGLGIEAGAGADFAVTNRFSLTPAVRYRSYDAGFNASELAARYWVMTLGAHLHLR
jgi:hypothetical protein